MGLDETQAGQSVRFSFGKENTVDEVLKCAEWTKEIVSGLVLEE
jgi:cysteine sulfinate desulfinase/cysteine desulfurase-like protein